MKVITSSRILSVTPTLDTNAYASGDQLGSLMEIDWAVDSIGGTGVLKSLSVVDKASQDIEIDVLLFSDEPTVTSSDNAALDISDAEMEAKCIGSVKVESGDYLALNANSIATKRDVGLLIQNSSKSGKVEAKVGKKLWAIARAGGAATYAASDLTFKFGIVKD